MVEFFLLFDSTGYMGECGLRGGYGEYVNMDPKVMAILSKSISAMLCPTVLGQVAMAAVVNPPKPGDPSYNLFLKEKTEVLESLAERSRLVVDTLNSIPGFKVKLDHKFFKCRKKNETQK